MICRTSNGLPVILDYMPNMESTVLSVWAKVGGAFETENQNGLAHFLEHMAFKGTKTRSAFDIAMEFDSIGGMFNACTGKESTIYYAKSLKKDFAKCCDIISDVILNSQFDPTEIVNEKKVVLQEIARTNDEAEDVINDHFMHAAYSKQAFGRSILGEPHNVESFSREDLFAFVDQYYCSDNMFVVVSGNFNKEEVMALLDEKFAKLKPSKSPITYDGGKYKGDFFWEERDLDQLHLILGFEGVRYVNESHYSISLLSAILGGGLSSRLFQEVREKRGLAYSIGSGAEFYNNTGLFTIATGIAPDAKIVEEFFNICGEQIRSIASSLENEELARVKSQLQASLLMKLEGAFTRAEFAGCLYRYFGKVLKKEEVLQKIGAVTVDDVRVAAESLLKGFDNLTCAFIGRGCKAFSRNKVMQFIS